MQLASFDLRDPVLPVLGHRLSVQVVTLENLYGLDAERTRAGTEGEGAVVHAAGLRWAGGQERAAGEVRLRARRATDGTTRVRVEARAPGRIRCVKLLVRDLDPSLECVRPDGSAAPVGPHGELWTYPGLLPAPLLALRHGGAPLGLRFEDPGVRAKRFALQVERWGELAGRGTVEMIHEEDASRFDARLASPELVIAPGADAHDLEAAHLRFARDAFGLVPWTERPGLPAFARGLRLVTTLHGMHYTGRVFLRYDEMLEILRFVAARVPGERVLAYLPGWEGRYYWQYGDYRPEPRLGGEDGFARLCDGARALGVHVMPMFGANCANVWQPGFAALPPEAWLKSATRNRFHGNQPDWDLSRAHDTGWQAWLNPGHPLWRDRLAGQIESLAERHGFDAVFLDTVHAWTNDPDHPVTGGLATLAARLRAAIPGVLLAGEADYDALLPIFDLFQRPWWTQPPAWTARYTRRFAHLCEGEPRGRTGVHELGLFAPRGDAPDPGAIATLAFQDGTLEACRDEIEATLRRCAAD